MIKARDIEIGRYNYNLPESRIAKYPLPERDMSKLLVYRNREITDTVFASIGDYLTGDNLLVFNNTRVIRARLRFMKDTGAAIEIFCLEPHRPADHAVSFASCESVEWICLVGNLKKWKSGTLYMNLTNDDIPVTLAAEQVTRRDEGVVIRFSWDANNLSFSEVLEMSGHIPVPPYLNRDDEEIDSARYQTVYSRYDGSVAAPTAGLHFTQGLLADLDKKGIRSAEVTLHVGAGTFVPVKSRTIGEHVMHWEHFSVTRELLNLMTEARVVAVGTTCVRTLESLYWLGVMIIEGKITRATDLRVEQWVPYEGFGEYSRQEALSALAAFMDRQGMEILESATSIIIVPGYRFRVTGALITNFHMPGSTLLLLVSALIGEGWQEVYNHAIENGYRFLSYGDSSLLMP